MAAGVPAAVADGDALRAVLYVVGVTEGLKPGRMVWAVISQAGLVWTASKLFFHAYAAVWPAATRNGVWGVTAGFFGSSCGCCYLCGYGIAGAECCACCLLKLLLPVAVVFELFKCTWRLHEWTSCHCGRTRF
jgi:hypothetical protein